MPPDRFEGVFETMLVRGGRIQSRRRHLDRLADSIAALYGMRLPADLEARLVDTAAGLAGEHRLRIDAVPGTDLTVTTGPVADGYRRPVTLEPLLVPGGLGSHKWRDRLLLDAAAPLLVDSDGSVLEVGWGNVWLLDGDRLVTPPADGRILPGVTRAVLLELAPSLGLHASEERISLHRARTAPVMFATSAIRLAVPAPLTGQPAPTAAPVDRIRAALSAY